MRTGSRTTGLAWLLAAGAVLVGAVFLVSTLAFLRENHWPGPAVDFWHFMKLLQQRAGDGDWLPLLVREHGGHRLLVPKLLYLVEYEWFQGRNVFLITTSIVLQAVTAALLIGGAWRERGRLPAPLLLFVSGFVAVLLFSGAQIENFLRPWNVHWFLVFLAAAVAFTAAARGSRARVAGCSGAATGWLVASVAAGWVATWTMANGLLVWPILIGLVCVLRLPVAWTLALGALAVAGAGSFFLGYEPHRNLAPGRLFADPGVQLLWVARALASPLVSGGGLLGGLVGALLLAAGGFVAVDFVRRRGTGPAVEPLLVGLLSFAGGSALLVATGRAADTWSAPRYQTTVLVYWAVLGAWGLLRLGRARAPVVLAGMAVCLLGLVVPAGVGHWRGLEDAWGFAEKIRKANLVIMVGIDHAPSYEATLPFADRLRKRDRVQRFRRGLLRREQGMFADGRHRLLGTRIGADLRVARGGCGGEVREIVPLSHPKTGRRVGTWVTGTAWLGAEDVMPEPLLVSDVDGVVSGLGEEFRFERWGAIVRPLRPGATATVYGSLPDGSVCRIADFEPGG